MFHVHQDLDTQLMLICRINYLLVFVFSWNLLRIYYSNYPLNCRYSMNLGSHAHHRLGVKPVWFFFNK